MRKDRAPRKGHWWLSGLPLLAVTGCFGLVTDADATDSSCPGGSCRQVDKALCEQTVAHFHSCNMWATDVDCEHLSADDACFHRCFLQASCASFQGSSPDEAQQLAECNAHCTCGVAERLAETCGTPMNFACDESCACGFLPDCEKGISLYAACRESCPAWP